MFLVALFGFLAPAASATSLPHPQIRVAAIERSADPFVGPSQTLLPGSGRPRAPSYDQNATGSSVAAEGGAPTVLNIGGEGEVPGAINVQYEGALSPNWAASGPDVAGKSPVELAGHR